MTILAIIISITAVYFLGLPITKAIDSYLKQQTSEGETE